MSYHGGSLLLDAVTSVMSYLLKTLASGTCLHDSSPIHLPRQWDSGFLLLTSMPLRAISSAKVISFLPA